MRTVNESNGNVPAFLTKLSQLVDDSETNHLISWSRGGRSFIIQNQAEFARELLPSYYKHNNMASFIRQLNMYGFHKVASTENGSLKCDKDEMEFSHPCFLQGRPNLLQHIKRKIANPKVIPVNSEDLKPELMNRVLSDMKQMKSRQESMDARFSVMKQENEALWREVALLRQKHIKQQQIVNNLIQFLMSLVQPSRNSTLNPGVKRKYQLMINNAAYNNDDLLEQRNIKLPKLESDLHFDSQNVVDDLDCGPIIHELGDHDVLPDDSNDEEEYQYATVEGPALSPRPLISSPLSNCRVNTPLLPSPECSALPVDSHLSSNVPEDNITGGVDPTQILLTFNNNKETNVNTDKILTSQSYPFPINPKKSSKSCIKVTKPGISPKSKIIVETLSKPVSLPEDKIIMQPTYSVPATPILPTDIFAEEDNCPNDSEIISDVDRQAAIAALQNVAADYVNSSDPPNNDQKINAEMANVANYLSNLSSENYRLMPGNMGIGQKSSEKKLIRRNKKKMDANKQPILKTNVKPQVSDDNRDSQQEHNMELVSVDKNISHQPFSVNDVSDHLDSMQSDLDSLREMLRGDSYSLDANTLLGLFAQEDPFYGLPLNTDDQNSNKGKEAGSDADQSGQLMWYVPPNQGLDFADMSLMDNAEETELENLEEGLDALPADSLSTLNTPQVEITPPSYTQQTT